MIKIKQYHYHTLNRGHYSLVTKDVLNTYDVSNQGYS